MGYAITHSLMIDTLAQNNGLNVFPFGSQAKVSFHKET